MIPPRLLAVNGILLVALLGSWRAERIRRTPSPLPRSQADFLRRMRLPFRDWATTDMDLSALEMEILGPDAYLVRSYRSPQGATAQLTVIVGHEKENIHTPGYCLPSNGWEFISQQGCELPLGKRTVPAIRSVASKAGRRILITYFFTNGDYATGSLDRFVVAQQLEQLRGERPLGGMVRIIVPFADGPTQAQRLSDEFANATLPPMMARLQQARRAVDAPALARR